MSNVTNIILAIPICDKTEKRIKEVNKFFGEDSCGFVDKELPKECYGGGKMLEAIIFIGAFNYISLDDFIEYLKTKVNWDEEYKSDVQVIVQEQEDNRFRIINVFDK